MTYTTSTFEMLVTYFYETAGPVLMWATMAVAIIGMVLFLTSAGRRLFLVWLAFLVVIVGASGHQGWSPNLPYGVVSLGSILKFPLCIGFALYGILLASLNRGAGRMVTAAGLFLCLILLASTLASNGGGRVLGRMTLLILFYIGTIHGVSELTWQLGPHRMFRAWLWTSIVIMAASVCWTVTHVEASQLTSRYRAFVGNANLYCLVAGGMMPPACWLVCRPGRGRLWGGILIAWWVISGLMSGSRGGVAIVASCLVAMLFYLRARVSGVVLVLSCLVLLFAIAAVLVPETSLGRFSSVGTAVLEGRAQTIEVGMGYFGDRPLFGHGFGWLEEDAQVFLFSSYMTLLVDLGILGTLAMLAVFLLVPIAAIRRPGEKSTHRLERAILLGFILGMFVNAAAEAWMVGVGGPALWLMFCAQGILAGQLRLQRTSRNVPAWSLPVHEPALAFCQDGVK